MPANKIKCPQCRKTFEPSKIEIGNNVDADTELLTNCPTTGCEGRFYTFVELTWEPLEN